MKEKYVILRRPVGTPDVFRGIRAAPASMDPPAGVTVEIEYVDRSRVAALRRTAGVEAACPVIPMQLIAPVAVPAAAMGSAQPVIDGIAWGVRAVGADTSPFTGEGIVVAVLDTGIDAAHPAFADVTEVEEEDFTGEGNGDTHGHGTHCAATIFGGTIEGTRIGVAPGVKKALIGKVVGKTGASTDSIVRGMEWALAQGAHVISMSLGMDFPGLVDQMVAGGLPVRLATSRALEAYRANVQLFERFASFMRARGSFTQASIIVSAAGNESQRDINEDFEIAVSPPAVAEGVISVAALGQGEHGLTIAPFSNTGANLAGPGVAIVSAKTGGGLATLSGTSMATPHVAGVAALWAQKIKAAGPLNTLQLTARVIASSTTEGLQAGFDPFDIGAGLVRAPQP